MIEPELNLFMDSSEGAPYYWLNVEIPTTSGYEITSHQSLPEAVNEQGEFHINIDLQTHSNGETIITVDIGQIEIDHQNGKFHVHLLNQSQTSLGNGIVKTKDATESTRPIPLP